MNIQVLKIKLIDLFKGYSNKGEEGIYAYDGKLTIRPSYQREFVYDEEERNAVINTIMRGLPLGVMYWAKTGEDTYEIIDGQQRTLSICEFMANKFRIEEGRIGYSALADGVTKDNFNNYELLVYSCEGRPEEKLQWFTTINTAGEPLNNQELRNAVYCGPFISSARKYFSKPGCSAIENGYIKGRVNRQELLQKALKWASQKDKVETIEEYMAIHQNDANADELYTYYNKVINWAKGIFVNPEPGITDTQNWGKLYEQYKGKTYDSKVVTEKYNKYMSDEDVNCKRGIIPYILSGEDPDVEKCLSIRGFSKADKRTVYERQKHKCPTCGKIFDFDQMDGDHVIPWSKGGRTVIDNLVMKCKNCNCSKGASYAVPTEKDLVKE